MDFKTRQQSVIVSQQVLCFIHVNSVSLYHRHKIFQQLCVWITFVNNVYMSLETKAQANVIYTYANPKYKI